MLGKSVFQSAKIMRDKFVLEREDGTREAADIYYSHLLFYPYQMYINWQPEEVGNILYNDKKFVTLLDVYKRQRICCYPQRTKKTILQVWQRPQ